MRSIDPTDVPPYFWTINTGGNVRDTTPSMAAAVVFSTFPTMRVATTIARTLVEERLVACVNLLPNARSIYHWQGEVEEASEVVAIMKTTQQRFAALRARVIELHPYDVPEVIALAVTDGHPGYLDWLRDYVTDSRGKTSTSRRDRKRR
jgi:periplasmic divalent cation tolerance protein